MWRLRDKNPYSAKELNNVISEILWKKIYMTSLVRKYPEVLNPCCNSDGSTTADACAAVKSYIENPLKLFLLTEGPDKDATWLQTLPNEAMRMTMKHCINLAQGVAPGAVDVAPGPVDVAPGPVGRRKGNTRETGVGDIVFYSIQAVTAKGNTRFQKKASEICQAQGSQRRARQEAQLVREATRSRL